MNNEQILKADLLDIIFEHRNKQYGAYDLRKAYSNRLGKALLGMLCIVTVVAAIAFIPKTKGKVFIAGLDGATLVNIPPAAKKIPPPIKVKPAVKTPVPSKKWVTKINFVQEKDSADRLEEIRNNDLISNVTVINTDKPVIFQTPIPIGKEVVKSESPRLDPSIPIRHPDVQPSFPGGNDALLRFLQKNLENPSEINEGESVSVVVSFIVNQHGQPEKFEIERDGGTVFNNEVLRVLHKMPKWNPGKTEGQNVSVYCSVPVKFMSAE
ncbi:MAG: energy transducer TonB [Ferruginibacter sp.]